jgi:hypothetical protein
MSLQDFLQLDWPLLTPHPGFSSNLAKHLLIERVAWLILQETGSGQSEIVAVCACSHGRISKSLIAIVITDPEDDAGFWVAIRTLVSQLHITQLSIERFSKLPRDDLVPTLPAERQRYRNVKLYIWRLDDEEWAARMSGNHRRNIHRARKAGVHVVTACDAKAVGAHIELIGGSLRRRAARGEPTSLASDARAVEEILSAGQALLFQAQVDKEVLSSKIIFQLDGFGYYDSGGTSEHGMKLGASHFLMHTIASDLRSRGVRTLNLDVASSSAGGLARFKAEFGTDEWHVTKVESTERGVVRLVSSAIRSAIGNLVRVRG